MKKFLAMLLTVALTASIAVAGTMAYLTDRDSKANVFTVGNVSIKLNEKFDPTTAELIPGVDIQKEATITNTGSNDAWVWLTVLIPEEMGPYTAPDNMSASNNVVHWNYPAESAANITVDFNSTPVEIDPDGDGVKESYYQTNMLWKNVLPAGETTGAMLSKVYMDTRVDIDPDGNMYWVVDGVATDLEWNVNEKGNPVIYVSAYAIQNEGFADVEAAYAAYQTQWGDNGAEYGSPATVVSTADELVAALAAGDDVVMQDTIKLEADKNAPYGNKYGIKLDGGEIDGNNNELYIECYGDDYGIMTSGGTIKNMTIEEGCRAVMIMSPTEDVILDNVNIGGDGVLYPINTGEAGSEGIDLIVTNSTLAGWTSYSNIESASFTNVTFKQGTYYNNIYGRVVKPYVNTTFTNCSFIEHMNLDLSSLGEGQKVTFTNCTVNGVAVEASVFSVAETDADYDTALFSVDLPSWATSVTDCVVFA